VSEEAIREFWESLEANRAALVDPVAPEAMNELLAALRRVDSRFYYHVGEHDEGVDLILSAEGHCEALPLLRQVRDGAPEVSGWNVLAVFDGDLVIGRRNPMLFPPDENGDVLYLMARQATICASSDRSTSPSCSRRPARGGGSSRAFERRGSRGNPTSDPRTAARGT